MDAKEKKQALKSARDAIRSKEFKDALKHCKSVLKHEGDNYNALVFVGVAAEGLEQPEQALAAYKRAAESDPKQLLAWQGLAGYYEKSINPDHKASLSEVYETIIDLQPDQTKSKDVKLKLADLYSQLGNAEKAIVLFQSLLGEQSQIDILKKIVQLIENLKEPTDDQFKLLGDTYSHLLDAVSDKEELLLYRHGYLKHLARVEDVEKLEGFSTHMHSIIPDDPVPLRYLCLVYLDKLVVINDQSEGMSRLQEYGESLLGLTPEDGVGHLVQGAVGIKSSSSEQRVKGKDHIAEGLKVETRSISGYILQAKASLQLHDHPNVQQSISKGKSLLKTKPFKYASKTAQFSSTLRLLQAKLYLDSKQNLEKGSTICEQLLGDGVKNVDILYTQGLLLVEQNKIDEAQKVLNDLEEEYSSDLAAISALRGWLHYQKQNYDLALESLAKALESPIYGVDSQYKLALVKWESQDKTEAFQMFLKAAKCDPYNSDIFLHLGHYYKHTVEDLQKARKCYQKAVDLNPLSESAGCALVDTLNELNEEELSYNLLKQVVGQSAAGEAKWAWLRLGLLELKRGNPTEAIYALQCALRADPTDNHVWECLAETYMSRGSFTAAMKAFSRALELEPSSMYARYQIATIKQSLGQLAEAVAEYKSVLEIEPTYVPALKGVGETYLLLVKSSLQNCFYGRAVDECQQAISMLTSAASVRPDLGCVWKLLGDACTILHSLPATKLQVKIPGKLLGKDEEGTCDKLELLALGARCFGKALKCLPECTSIWYDLGNNYFRQSQHAPATAQADLIKKSIAILKQALVKDPTNANLWNALGCVACSPGCQDNALAQHCFIKSINQESSVVAWTNLGVLYLQTSHIELAHEAFKIAQSLEPSYVNCWIGQALIAETVGDDDAMDLFRHSTELANHNEAGLGYASWVCATLQDSTKMQNEAYSYNIQHMAAIPASADALSHFTDGIENDDTAFNLYGLILEQQKLLRPAIVAYKKAIEILKETNDERLTSVKLNCARALVGVKQYKESIAIYQAVGALGKFEDLCWMGLAYYHNNDLTQSYQAYEQALTLAPCDEDKSHVYAALGMVAFKFNDLADAKSALFQSSQFSTPSTGGLEALCSLGLLQKDPTLATAVLNEFSKCDAKSDVICYLQSSILLQQNDFNGAKRTFAKSLHTDPGNGRLWLLTSEHIAQYWPRLSAAGAHCARIAHTKNADASPGIVRAAVVSDLGTGGASKDRLAAAQKAVHMYPDSEEHLCCLLASLHSENVRRQVTNKDTSLNDLELVYNSLLMSKVEAAIWTSESNTDLQGLHQWSVRHHVASLLTQGKFTEANEFLSQAKEIYSNDDDLDALLAYASGDSLLANQNSTGPSLSLKLQSEVNVYQGLVDEAHVVYKQILASCLDTSTANVREATLLRLAHLAFKEVLGIGSGGDAWKWKDVAYEALQELRRVNPWSPAAMLMKGILSMVHEKNARKAKRVFQEMLQNSPVGSEATLAPSIARSNLLKLLMRKETTEEAKELLKEYPDDKNLQKLFEDIKISIAPKEAKVEW
ncbi:unnamed protein product [Owenia fusiformis]|uniref:Tetratricopeptide repeat protein 37 n=1 Tax=Owenia fusiformis TaxID=6347 RepID=A0A8S4PS54_OWEFU|nr:unnamed protein product [Owenia fusiformis]